ncbi:hypothetical protein ASZ90_018020 [hydrocarbon metagenome]|uniref:Uncharacterized protein n=1 Tax=hydrocarbon metagenome TaxID=938273 RepID=A0A0W8E826_9ZZZZ
MFLSPDTPILDISQINIEKIRAFIIKLLDVHTLEIDDPFALNIYNKGIRPRYSGVDKMDVEDSTLNNWFIDRSTADIYRLTTASEEQFERYLDLVDLEASQTLLKLGSIAAKYDLYPADYNENGIKKITDAAEREHFEKFFLDGVVLNSAFQLLAGVYYQIHGKLYVIKT